MLDSQQRLMYVYSGHRIILFFYNFSYTVAYSHKYFDHSTPKPEVESLHIGKKMCVPVNLEPVPQALPPLAF